MTTSAKVEADTITTKTTATCPDCRKQATEFVQVYRINNKQVHIDYMIFSADKISFKYSTNLSLFRLLFCVKPST